MAIFYGIDAGSSFIKGAILDLDRLEIRSPQRVPFPPFVEGLPPGCREVEPGLIVHAVESVLARLREQEPRCHGLVLCGQMHGFVLVDAAGEAASNYISWLDRRVTAESFEQLRAKLSDSQFRELGNEFRSSIALPMLWWLKQQGTLPPGTVTPVSIADFVAGQLCQTRPVMDPTQAAAFGGLRLGTTDWYRELIDELDLTAIAWPEVRPTGSVAGRWQGLPCYASIGDQQCALAGALLGEREISVNIGTGSQVAMITSSLPSDRLQTRPYFDGQFLRTITHIPGGRALSALVHLLTELGATTEEDAWPRIQAAVAATPTTDVEAGIAFFPGPCGDHGFLNGLHEDNLHVGPVFRAVFESMAKNCEATARQLDPSRNAERLVFSGGVSRQLEIVRRLTAEALGLPYRLSPHPEDTMFGLLVLALAFSGLQPTVRAATEAAAAHAKPS